nr:hypothetical protein [uncultured Brevundimonas sp.]
MIRLALSAVFVLLLSAPALAQTETRAPAAQTPRPSAQTRAPAFTLDTPIERLVADPRARTVLERELPGLTTHDRYNQFKGLSLRRLKPFSGGLLTDARLAAVEAALAAL